MLSISESVDSSFLSLLAALINLSREGGVLLILKNLSIVFNPPNFSVNVFGSKNSPVPLLVGIANVYYNREKAIQYYLFLNFS